MGAIERNRVSSRRVKLFSIGSFVLGAASFVVALLFLATGESSFSKVDGDLPFIALLLLWGTLGALLSARVPSNPIGWILCGMGAVSGVSFLAQVYANVPGAAAGSYAAWFMGWTSDWLPPLLIAYMLLLFPTGRLSTKLDRICAVAMVSVVGAGCIGEALSPGRLPYHDLRNPLGVDALESVTSAIESAATPLMALAILAIVVSMVRRFRYSVGIEREQLKWFCLAATVLAVSWVVGGIATAVGGDTGVGAAIGVGISLLALTGLPVAITVAVLRYKLYEIDVLINRALVYGPLTALLIAAYVGVVFAMQALLDPITSDSDLSVAASTLVVAALFRPLRRRMQSLVDHRFYRRKYDSAEALASLTSFLRNEVEIDSVRVGVLEAVNETVQPVHAAVWLAPRSVR
jgi:hypothetical protein